MLYYQIIRPETLELLKNIQQVDIFKNLRLVGGTSLALQIGHRISDDIDLFGKIEVDRFEIISNLEKIGRIKTIRYSNNIHIFTLNNVKVDIVNYKYPWLNDVVKIDNLSLADIKDIAAMKISAITGRGSKKDFIDLYFLLKQYELHQLIDFYQQKYNDASVFLSLKSLTYFTDADDDVMPKMFIDVSWNDIKKIITKEVKEYINQ